MSRDDMPGKGLPELERYVRLIAATIAVENGFTPEQLLGPSRVRSLVVVRHFAIWLAWRWTGAPLTVIGRAFFGRDHTTVMYAIGRCEERAKRDPAFASHYEELTAKIGRPSEAVQLELRGKIEQMRRRDTAHRQTLAAVSQAREAWVAAKQTRKAQRAAERVAAARRLLQQKADDRKPVDVPFYEGGERACVNRRGSLARQNDAFVAAMTQALKEECAQ